MQTSNWIHFGLIWPRQLLGSIFLACFQGDVIQGDFSASGTSVRRLVSPQVPLSNQVTPWRETDLAVAMSFGVSGPCLFFFFFLFLFVAFCGRGLETTCFMFVLLPCQGLERVFFGLQTVWAGKPWFHPPRPLLVSAVAQLPPADLPIPPMPSEARGETKLMLTLDE